MPLDPRARRLLDMLALAPAADPATLTAEARRSGFRALMAMARPAPAAGVAVTETAVRGAAGALPARLYAPAGAAGEAGPGLVFFHGGGLVAGDLDTHDGLCRHLAAGSGARVVSVAYRLAPEHRFPAAVEDAMAATAAVLADAPFFGMDPGRIGVGGDSAGGTLAAVAAGRLGHALALQLLLCPVLDHAGRRPSRLAFASGYMLDQAVMDRDLAHLLPPGTRPDHPDVSPLRALSLAGLPPTLLHAAEFDPLRDEARDYADALARAGVPVRFTCHPGMIHHFLGLDGLLPTARGALAAIGAELAAAFAARTST